MPHQRNVLFLKTLFVRKAMQAHAERKVAKELERIERGVEACRRLPYPTTIDLALASVLAPPVAQIALENPLTRAWAANRLASNVPTLPGRELTANIGLAQALAMRGQNERRAAGR